MIKKLIILISSFCLSGCIGLSIDKGYYLENSWDKISEMERESITKTKIFTIDDEYFVHLGLPKYCSSFGFYGFILPIIPRWSSNECNQLNIAISFNKKADEMPKTKNLEEFLKIRDLYVNKAKLNNKLYKNNLEIVIRDEDRNIIYETIKTSEYSYTFPIQQGEIKNGSIILNKRNKSPVIIPLKYGKYFYLFL